MIVETGFEALGELRALSHEVQWGLLLEAVAAGNSRARGWRVGKGHFVWDQANNVFYLGGEPPERVDLSELSAWVVDGLRPLALAERRARFSVHLLNEDWEGLLSPLFRGVAFTPRDKQFYRFNGEHARPVAHQAGVDVRLELIDAGFLARGDLQGMDGLLAEIEWMWPSIEHFCRAGFGLAAVKTDRVICRCTAEYLSAGMCGIGIETDESYERLGVATAVTVEFVNRALERGARPHWECDAQNTGSARVAEKAGFDLLQETRVWVGRFI